MLDSGHMGVYLYEAQYEEVYLYTAKYEKVYLFLASTLVDGDE